MVNFEGHEHPTRTIKSELETRTAKENRLAALEESQKFISIEKPETEDLPHAKFDTDDSNHTTIPMSDLFKLISDDNTDSKNKKGPIKP